MEVHVTVKKLIKKSNVCAAVLHTQPISELRCVTSRMGSHSVTCYTTQVNVPNLDPSQEDRYLTYLPGRDERLSWSGWLVIYRDGLPVQ